jgi:hypothetical protein
LLIIVSGIGTGAYFYLQHDEKPQNRLDLYGNVDIRQVQLAFHATGRIEKLSVREGDEVKPGQVPFYWPKCELPPCACTGCTWDHGATCNASEYCN